MLDWIVTLKGEHKKSENKKFEYELHLMAHIGSASDTYIASNNFPTWRGIVIVVKNGKGIISSKIFDGHVKCQTKAVPQYVNFG